jgi:hypothetical protein
LTLPEFQKHRSIHPNPNLQDATWNAFIPNNHITLLNGLPVLGIALLPLDSSQMMLFVEFSLAWGVESLGGDKHVVSHIM